MFQTRPEFNSDEGKRLFNFTFFTLFPNKYNYRQLQDENLLVWYNTFCTHNDLGTISCASALIRTMLFLIHSHLMGNMMRWSLIFVQNVERSTVPTILYILRVRLLVAHITCLIYLGQSSNTCVEDSKHLGVGTIGFEDVPCSNDCGKFKSVCCLCSLFLIYLTGSEIGGRKRVFIQKCSTEQHV